MRGKMGFEWRIEEKPSGSYIVLYKDLFRFLKNPLLVLSLFFHVSFLNSLVNGGII